MTPVGLYTDHTTRSEELSVEVPPLQQGSAALIQIRGGELGKRYSVEGELTVGRNTTNDVVLQTASVSRNHALIYQRDSETLIVDRGSTNGTFVNGTNVTAEAALEHGDLIKIGEAIFRFIGTDNAEAAYHQEIYDLATTDGLTGLRNRRYFDDFLEREVARSRRSGNPLSLALFDLDNFKQLNDEHGHLFGDAVLREIADLVGPRVRREQLFARFGGDEFGVVLPDVPLEGALTFGRRVAERVAQHAFSWTNEETGSVHGPVQVTLSLGIASRDSESAAQELLERADQSLYVAKSEGRNAVVALQERAGE